MGCSTKMFRVATVEGSERNTIALPLRNINVLAYPEPDFGKLHPCPYLTDPSIEYPKGDGHGQAGWDIAVPYDNIANLADKLDAGVILHKETKRRFGPRYSQAIQPGEILRLGIMSHGDQGGRWFANPKKHYFPLMAKPQAEAETVDDAADALKRIGKYVKPSGSTIVLVGCMAGQGKGGTELLMALSALWPNTYVVAFDVIGYRFPGVMSKGLAGNGEYSGMKLTWYRSEVEYAGGGEDKIRAKWDQLEWASEYSKDHAKIVLDQKVLHWPSEEAGLDDAQTRRPSSAVKDEQGPTSKGAGGSSVNKAPQRQYPPSWSRPPSKPRR